MPLIKKGAIRAVFLGDEVCCVQGVPGSNISFVATIIRKFLRTTTAGINTLIYLSECTRALHPATGSGYLGNPLLADIDAISLDGYGPSKPNGCSSAEREGFDEEYLQSSALPEDAATSEGFCSAWSGEISPNIFSVHVCFRSDPLNWLVCTCTSLPQRMRAEQGAR